MPYDDLIADAFFLKTIDGRYLSINGPGATMVGSTPSEIVGQSDFEIFDDLSANQTLEWDRKVIETKTTLTYRDISTAKLKTRVYHSTKSPLFDSAGNVVAVLGISRDISLSFAYQGAKELCAPTDFSHEFKTPLTILQTALELEVRDLEHGIIRPSEFRRKLLKNANSAALRLRQLLEALSL